MKNAGLGFYGVARKRQEVGKRATGRSCHVAGWGRRNAQCSRPVVRTLVLANVELGAHNALFIRGQGGGLSWDYGQPFTRLGNETWIWSGDARADRLEFQLLLNDEVWERARAHILEPGSSIELAPDFEWPEIPRTCPPGGHRSPKLVG